MSILNDSMCTLDTMWPEYVRQVNALSSSAPSYHVHKVFYMLGSIDTCGIHIEPYHTEVCITTGEYLTEIDDRQGPERYFPKDKQSCFFYGYESGIDITQPRFYSTERGGYDGILGYTYVGSITDKTHDTARMLRAVGTIIHAMKNTYKPYNYGVVGQNCQDFTEDFISHLTEDDRYRLTQVPGYSKSRQLPTIVKKAGALTIGAGDQGDQGEYESKPVFSIELMDSDDSDDILIIPFKHIRGVVTALVVHSYHKIVAPALKTLKDIDASHSAAVVAVADASVADAVADAAVAEAEVAVAEAAEKGIHLTVRDEDGGVEEGVPPGVEEGVPPESGAVASVGVAEGVPPGAEEQDPSTEQDQLIRLRGLTLEMSEWWEERLHTLSADLNNAYIDMMNVQETDIYEKDGTSVYVVHSGGTGTIPILVVYDNGSYKYIDYHAGLAQVHDWSKRRKTRTTRRARSKQGTGSSNCMLCQSRCASRDSAPDKDTSEESSGTLNKFRCIKRRLEELGQFKYGLKGQSPEVTGGFDTSDSIEGVVDGIRGYREGLTRSNNLLATSLGIPESVPAEDVYIVTYRSIDAFIVHKALFYIQDEEGHTARDVSAPSE